MSTSIKSNGKILFLTNNLELLSDQILRGRKLSLDVCQDLMNGISTDEITPVAAGFWFDDKVADFCYTGLRGKKINSGEIRAFSPEIIVSGQDKGCGSSREHAPLAEKICGAKIIFARSFASIYRQNCRNIGLLTCENFEILAKLYNDEDVNIEEILADQSDFDRKIYLLGGLLKAPPNPKTEIRKKQRPSRALNLVEKIIARHSPIGTVIEPGQVVFVKSDIRFTHEFFTALVLGRYTESFSDNPIYDPKSVFVFRDHLNFLGAIKETIPNGNELMKRRQVLWSIQTKFAKQNGVKEYGSGPRGGSEAICHVAVLEDLALPNHVVLGTDSHTCMAGALGALAIGVGATEMAFAFKFGGSYLKVPEVIRIELHGCLEIGITAKDLMHFILQSDLVSKELTLGRAVEFGGPGLKNLIIDERATIANMGAEIGATTIIVETDDMTVEYLEQKRQLGANFIEEAVPDKGASYYLTREIDLKKITTYVALPGDPRNSIPLDSLSSEVRSLMINIAYGGSCTSGKNSDLDMYAEVLSWAKQRNIGLAAGLKFYIQVGSQNVWAYAKEKGYIELFSSMGVELLEPSCGACISAGPGTGLRSDDIIISAVNRNYSGRNKAQVYLSSPLTVAASAIHGRIVSFNELIQLYQNKRSSA